MSTKVSYEEYIDDALEQVRLELLGAYENFPDMRSAHEGAAIVEEEFLEFRDAAFWPHKHIPGSDEVEARQLAAMAVRYMVDVCYRENTPR